MSSTPQRRTRRMVALAAAIPLAAAVITMPIALGDSADTQSRAVLAGSQPDFATAQTEGEPVPDSQELTVNVYLASRDPSGLAATARAVSDPTSPQYGQFLTYDAFEKAYGPDPAVVSKLSTYLKTNGVTTLSTTAHYLKAKGTVSAFDKIFGTTLHTYNTPQGPATAPNSDLSLPADLRPAVLAVDGLATDRTGVRPASLSATPADTGDANDADGAADTGGSTDTGAADVPCSPYWGAKAATSLPEGAPANTPYAPCAYKPSQLRTAYGVTDSKLTGKGGTIAVVLAYASPMMEADADRFSQQVGDAPFRPGQYTEAVDTSAFNRDPKCGPASVWTEEEALDVEVAHGMAPDANILYAAANSCHWQDMYDTEASVIDGHRADVITNSWAGLLHSEDTDWTPNTVQGFEVLFQQAAAMGIGVYFGSGDCGDNVGDPMSNPHCDPGATGPQTNYPPASPWVTAVGGTALATNATGGYAWETDFGDELAAVNPDGTWSPYADPGMTQMGGGGGTSEDFAQPWYQSGVVPDTMARTLMSGKQATSPMRVVPDVAMNGDTATGDMIGYTVPPPTPTTAPTTDPLTDPLADPSGAPSIAPDAPSSTPTSTTSTPPTTPQTGTFRTESIGGTSEASPAFAAMQVDAQQATGKPLGFANPLLYQRSKTAGTFHDIVAHPTGAPTNPSCVFADPQPDGTVVHAFVLLGRDHGLTAAPGYDNATGLGSPAAYLTSFTSATTAPSRPVDTTDPSAGPSADPAQGPSDNPPDGPSGDPLTGGAPSSAPSVPAAPDDGTDPSEAAATP